MKFTFEFLMLFLAAICFIVATLNKSFHIGKFSFNPIALGLLLLVLIRLVPLLHLTN